MSTKQRPNLDECVETLARIIAAVQHKNERGQFPVFPNAQSFDDWAGNIAAKALGYSGIAAIDKHML